MNWRRLAILLFAAAMAGCGGTTPFATAPLAAQPGVKDAGPRVAICYNSVKTSAEEIQKLAQQQCFGGAVAERVDTDYRMDDCPLLTPGRATFVCKPAK